MLNTFLEVDIQTYQITACGRQDLELSDTGLPTS